MVTITVFRNWFSDEHEQLIKEAGLAVKEYVRFNPEASIVYVNGFKRDENFILQDDDVCLIREFPDATAATAIVIGIIAIGAYVVTDAVVQAFTGKHIHEHIADGLKSWLLGDTGEDSYSDVEKIPQLRGAKNKSALDQPVPFILGKHLFAPYKIGNGYTQISGEDGEDQIYKCAYMVGYTGVIPTYVKLGDLTVSTNGWEIINGFLTIDSDFVDNNLQIEVRQTGELQLYPQKIVEEALSIELHCAEVGGVHKRNEPIRFSSRYAQKLEVEIYLPALISYDKEGKKESASVWLQAQYRSINGEWFQWIDLPVFTGAESTTYTIKKSVPVSKDYPEGIAEEVVACSKITRQKTKGMRLVSTLTLPYSAYAPDVYEIRLRRLDPNKNDSRTQDSLYWTAIRTWCYDKKASDSAGSYVIQRPVPEKLRVKTCRMAISVKADDELRGTLDSMNAVFSSFARTWNGSSWVSKSSNMTLRNPTNNPASLVLLAMQSGWLGKRVYSDAEIDFPSFAHFSSFCNTKGFTANGVITTQKQLQEVVSNILSACRATLIVKDNKRSILIDEPRSYPVTVLNQQNTIEATNHKNFDEIPDGIKITFTDEADGWQINELYVMQDGKSESDPDMDIMPIQVPFITLRTHAYRYCRYLLACMILRPERWIRKVGPEGHGIPYGSLVEIQDDTILVGNDSGGIITSVLVTGGQAVAIQCDSYFQFEAGKTYGVKIVRSDGISNPVVETVQVVNTGNYTNEFEFSSPVSWIPEQGDIVAFGEYSKITIDAILVGKTQFDDQTFELTLVPYDPAIYNADTEPIPPFDSRLSPPNIDTTSDSQDSYATLEDIAEAISGIAVVGDDTWIPDTVSIVQALAVQNGIEIKWAWSGSGIKNNIKKFTVELTKNGGTDWAVIAETNSNTADYAFVRADDGYPESDVFSDWRVRVKAENIYSRTGGYGPDDAGQAVDSSLYIGWTPATPAINTRVSGRGVSVGWSFATKWYGQGDVDLQIAKGYTVDAEGEIELITDTGTLEAYAPATGVDPVLSYENYREGDPDGFLTRAGNAFFIALPLYGQNEDPISSRDTPYYIRVRSVSTQPTTAEPSGRKTSTWTTWTLVYAHASNAQDVLRAWKLDDLGEKVKIDGALGADQIYVNFLAALSSNLGVITDGALQGNENNMWALSRIYEEDGITVRYYEGTLRVGDSNQYLRCTPVVSGGVVTSYNLEFKVGSFLVTAVGSVINGEFEVRNQAGTTARFKVDATTGATIVSGGGDVSLSAGTGRLLIGDPAAEHIAIDENEIMAKANGTTPTTLYLNDDGGSVECGEDLKVAGALTFLGGRSPVSIGSDGQCIQISNQDIHTVRNTGFYMGYNVTNSPNIEHWWYFDVRKHNNIYLTIDAIGFTHVGLHFRKNCFNGSWQGWYPVWNSGNDGPGSGLDADLLDGQHGSYYAPKASPALTGSPTINGHYAAAVSGETSSSEVNYPVGSYLSVFVGNLEQYVHRNSVYPIYLSDDTLYTYELGGFGGTVQLPGTWQASGVMGRTSAGRYALFRRSF